MPFRDLPIRLRVYILASAVLLLPFGWGLLHWARPTSALLTLGLLLSAAVFSVWKVELNVASGRMTATYAVTCLAMLMQGPIAASLCAVVGTLVGAAVQTPGGSWKPQLARGPWYRLFFNTCNAAVAAVAAVAAYTAAADGVRHPLLAPPVGLAAFTAAYSAVNTVGIAMAAALQDRGSWSRVWRQQFLGTAGAFFAAAVAALAVHLLAQRIGPWTLLFVPPLYLIYHSYRLYMERIQLFAEKVQQDMAHIQELNRLNQAVIASLATAIDAKDRYTCSHINRVQHYATALARAAGLTGPDLEAVATGALVHDIGKLGVPDHILGKPGKLTPEEFKRIQSHVTIGAEILAPVPFPFPVVDVVLTHHERWDGLGYPRGLKEEEIYIGGRIIAIVDVYDALTSNRPYRRAMNPDEAVAVLRDGAGKQFDPRLVEIFARILPRTLKELARLDSEAGAESRDSSAAPEGGSALTQISQAAAEMAAVCDVAHSLAEQQTLQAVASVVVDRALALLPADTAVLYLMANETTLVAEAVRGKYEDKLLGMTIQVGEGVAGWVAGHQQPRINVSAALDVARRFTPEETLELSAAIAVPLVHGPDTLGVLAVYTQAYSVLSEHHLHVLNVLAEHAAAATQNLRRLERNQELVFTDQMTGLANSRCLVRHMDRLITLASRPVAPGENQFSVVMMDLDGFKTVNDTLGHLKGDERLRRVAGTLSSLARSGDIVCRYAGDEFVLLLPSANRDQAERVAARVRDTIDGLPLVDGQVKIGASLGVASYPDDGNEGRTLLNVADRRMYEDKFHRKRSRGGKPAGELAGVG